MLQIIPKPVFGALIAATAAGAFVFRAVDLDHRPMHGDEANQAYKAGILLEDGYYRYDPHEHHGPTLYYLTLPSFWLRGETGFAESEAATYRFVPAIFGAGLVLLVWPFARALGGVEALSVALLTALSPAMVFYSRYYIQETLLVFFTLAALVAGWRYWRTRRLRWAVATGAALALMQATKETAVISYAAMAGALIGVSVWTRVRPGAPVGVWERVKTRHVLVSAGVAAAVSIALFSSFFTNVMGPIDSVRTYGVYLSRAEGEGSEGPHNKPWWYYLGLLLYTQRETGPVWSEAMIVLLAIVGAVYALVTSHTTGGSRLPLFLTIYAALMLAAYSVIPYKTPWSMLGALHGLILVAGFGAGRLIRATRKAPIRALVAVALTGGVLHLARQAHDANFTYAADVRNPYVYAHTSTALVRMVDRMNAIADLHEDGRALPVALIGNQWPLPWYLRRFERVGYWRSVPDELDEALIVAPTRLYPEIEPRLHGAYQVEHYSLRPGALLHLYIRQDLWDAFMETRR